MKKTIKHIKEAGKVNGCTTIMTQHASFGDKLQYLRQKKSITQKECASALGITQGMLSYYEAGKSKPTLEVAEKIAVYFNVSMDWLVNPSNIKSKRNTSSEKLKLTEEEVAIIKAYRSSDCKIQQIVICALDL